MNPTETKETSDVTGTTETIEATEPTEPVATETDEHDEAEVGAEAEAEVGAEAEAEADETPGASSSGIGAAAAGVVAAGLGVVALSGSWVGKIASERQTLIGQIETSQGTPAQQISAIYGDAWHTTALFNGIFALVALIVGVAVLAWPQKAGWVRAFAAAGVVLGVLGLIVAAGMYFDLFLELPSTGS